MNITLPLMIHGRSMGREARIHEDGWVAEYKIRFISSAFPQKINTLGDYSRAVHQSQKRAEPLAADQARRA